MAHETPLHAAALDGDLLTVKSLMKKRKSEADAVRAQYGSGPHSFRSAVSLYSVTPFPRARLHA